MSRRDWRDFDMTLGPGAVLERPYSAPPFMPAKAGTQKTARTGASGLERLDLHHARHGFDGARDLRRDLETPGQLHFDLCAALEQQHHADFPIAVCAAYVSLRRSGRPGLRYGLQSLGHRIERRAIAQEYAQTFLQIRGGI